MSYSFKCRQMYHAPTDCATIRKWLTKCADDSETANYISAHTKDVREHCAYAAASVQSWVWMWSQSSGLVWI